MTNLKEIIKKNNVTHYKSVYDRRIGGDGFILFNSKYKKVGDIHKGHHSNIPELQQLQELKEYYDVDLILALEEIEHICKVLNRK